MASRFMGRDYATLRAEIIEFLRVRVPKNWDYTNLADPLVIFAESLARMGDQLHFIIDEVRRECDVATAKRASSIYSYAMREGYKMMLPRASFGTIAINTTKEQDGLLHLNLKQFDEIIVNPLGESLYVVNSDNPTTGYAINADLHAPVDENYVSSLKEYETEENRKKAMSLYQSYFEDIYNKTQHVKVVLGTKTEFPFTYNDINNDSTVELPNPLIDRDLVRLSYTNSKMSESGTPVYKQLQYVDDVISSGFIYESFTLTPKFIGGAVTLCIEFPTNYRDIFNNDVSTKFKFEYINIKSAKIDPLEEYQNNADAVSFPDGAITVVSGHEEDTEISENGLQYRVNFGDGIKGYSEYENALVTRDNYKKFVQNYSALLTKDDYSNYIKALTHSYCKVYDHGDMYKLPPVLPADANLLPRAIYILTDSNYDGRENLWNDLKERSSRSDCIVMIPFGKDPYTIVIKAECYLVGTSIASVATQIEQALTLYYAGLTGEKIPKISMINYLTHKASDKVIKMESLIVRDSTFGTIDTTFNSVNQLDNDQIDALYAALSSGSISYESPLSDPALDAEGNTDYKYWLRGTLYEDESGNILTKEGLDDKIKEQGTPIKTIKRYYSKYPQLTYTKYDETSGGSKDKVVLEYEDFPEHFPRLYYIDNDSNEIEFNDYETLVDHQIAYGELDSKNWDFADTGIYGLYEKEVKNSFNKSKYIKYTFYNSSHNATTDILFSVNDTNFWSKADEDPLCIREKNTSDAETQTGLSFIVFYEHGSSIEQEILTFPFGSIISEFEEPEGNSRFVSGPVVMCETDSKPIPSSESVTPTINELYKTHHYMVPVLNKVVVLIKSVNSVQ